MFFQFPRDKALTIRRDYAISFTYSPQTVKSLCDAQENWNAERLKDIFKTKSAFNKERRKQKTVYNSRSAYMKAHGLNAVTVKDDWEKIKNAAEDPIWLAHAHELTSEGSESATLEWDTEKEMNPSFILVCWSVSNVC